LEDVGFYLKGLLLILIPIAVCMVFQYLTNRNPFSILGGVLAEAELRNGHVRASGPFRSALVAGTVGAVCLPACIAFWRSRHKSERLLAKAGLVAVVLIPLTTTASGPLMTLALGITGMLLWRKKQWLPKIVCLLPVVLIALHLVMKAPVWYLMAHIDLAGGSNGWFRARLIDAAIEHFPEWWRGGTDYTKDWMPTGVTWSEDNSDICNQYILMGVVGGLPLMLIFIAIVVSCFRHLPRAFQAIPVESSQSRFLIWCLGVMLFAHAGTMFTIDYYESASVAVLYSLFAAIASACPAAVEQQGMESMETPQTVSEEGKGVLSGGAYY
jgi:hypothetical protein